MTIVKACHASRHRMAGVQNAQLCAAAKLVWGATALGARGLSQDWGSGGDCQLRVRVVGWLELLSEAGTERAIVDGAANL